MGGRKEKCKNDEELVDCQVCDLEGHKAPKCPWLYSKCNEVKCNGLMMLGTSNHVESYGSKYLKCQFNSCKGFQTLEEAMNESSYTKKSPSSSSSKPSNSDGFSTPTRLGCFECKLYDHWANNCPWKGS